MRAPRVALGLANLLDAAEAPPRLPASLARRPSGRDQVTLGQLEMREDLVVELPVHPGAAGERHHPPYGLPQRPHGLASMNRATSAVALAHFSASTCSCAAPAGVRA